FDHVGLVGIFNADKMIHFPDFRSYERAFQLITQVSGRAGRREKPGMVIIQTSNPDHPLLQVILQHKTEEFYRLEEADRMRNHYPPFTRLVELTLKHTDRKVCRTSAERLAEVLRHTLSGVRIMGPGEPLIARIRNQYLMNILIKIPRGAPGLAEIKHGVQVAIAGLAKEKEHRNTRVIVDVDPV